MCFGEYDSTDACEVLCAQVPSYLLAMLQHLRSGLYTFNLQVSRAAEDGHVWKKVASLGSSHSRPHFSALS